MDPLGVLTRWGRRRDSGRPTAEATRDTYTVRAKRWERGWELHITGPDGYEGVTRTRWLKSAERMARSYVSLDRQIPVNSFDMDVDEKEHDDAQHTP